MTHAISESGHSTLTAVPDDPVRDPARWYDPDAAAYDEPTEVMAIVAAPLDARDDLDVAAHWEGDWS